MIEEIRIMIMLVALVATGMILMLLILQRAYAGASRGLSRSRTWRHRLFALTFTGLAVVYGSVKPNNGSVGSRMRSGALLADGENLSVEDLDAEEENGFRISGFTKADDEMDVEIVWPAAMQFVDDEIVVSMSTEVDDDVGFEVARVRISDGMTNATAHITYDDFPEVIFDHDQAFFRVTADVDESNVDSDDDGLSDHIEAALGCDPLNEDTDGDGVADGDEYSQGTDPCDADTDGDGISDGDEFANGSDAFVDESRLVMPAGPYYVMSGSNTYVTQYIENDADGDEVANGMSFLSVSGSAVEVPGISYSDPWTNKFNRTGSGMTFTPLYTGYYSFQMLQADDEATVQIGPITVTGSYRGEKPLAEGLLIASNDYPVTVSAYNDGGPAGLSFRKWGEFRPIGAGRLATKVSKSAIVFEKGFTDTSGRQNQYNSTESVYSVSAGGGEYGGTLSFETVNIDKLRMQSCSSLPASVSIAAGGSYNARFVFSGESPSQITNDIVFVAKFRENMTGNDIVVTNLMTAFEISIENSSTYPADRKRHRVGVAEELSIVQNPASPLILGDEILADNGSMLQSAPDRWKMIAPWRKKSFVITAQANGAYGFRMNFRTLEPAYVKLINPQVVSATAASYFNNIYEDMHLPILRSGDVGVLMKADVCIMPGDVCFSKIRFYESEAPATHRTGLFCDEIIYPDSMIGHNANNGARTADDALSVGDDNVVVGFDIAGGWLATSNESQEYVSSQYRLDIPVFWFVYDGDNTIADGHRMRDSIQIVYLLTNGTMGVYKQGVYRERSIFDESDED